MDTQEGQLTVLSQISVVLNRSCCRSREIIVADEIPYGTNVVGQFLRERQRFAYQTGQTLPQRVVETFDVIGLVVLNR